MKGILKKETQSSAACEEMDHALTSTKTEPSLSHEARRLPIHAIQISTRNFLAKWLNPNEDSLNKDCRPKCWIGLAEIINFDPQDIRNFERQSSPTQALLCEYEGRPGATVGELWDCILELERHDIICNDQFLKMLERDKDQYRKRRERRSPEQKATPVLPDSTTTDGHFEGLDLRLEQNCRRASMEDTNAVQSQDRCSKQQNYSLQSQDRCSQHQNHPLQSQDRYSQQQNHPLQPQDRYSQQQNHPLQPQDRYSHQQNQQLNQWSNSMRPGLNLVQQPPLLPDFSLIGGSGSTEFSHGNSSYLQQGHPSGHGRSQYDPNHSRDAPGNHQYQYGPSQIQNSLGPFSNQSGPTQSENINGLYRSEYGPCHNRQVPPSLGPSSNQCGPREKAFYRSPNGPNQVLKFPGPFNNQCGPNQNDHMSQNGPNQVPLSLSPHSHQFGPNQNSLYGSQNRLNQIPNYIDPFSNQCGPNQNGLYRSEYGLNQIPNSLGPSCNQYGSNQNDLCRSQHGRSETANHFGLHSNLPTNQTADLPNFHINPCQTDNCIGRVRCQCRPRQTKVSPNGFESVCKNYVSRPVNPQSVDHNCLNARSVNTLSTDNTVALSVPDMMHGKETFFDAFISSCDEDKEVKTVLRNDLEKRLNYRICDSHRDLLPGRPELKLTADILAERCKKIILLFTPRYLKSKEYSFQSNIALNLSYGTIENFIVPVLVEPCEIPLVFRPLTYVDNTSSDSSEWFWIRLIAAIKSGEFIPEEGEIARLKEIQRD